MHDAYFESIYLTCSGTPSMRTLEASLSIFNVVHMTMIEKTNVHNGSTILASG